MRDIAISASLYLPTISSSVDFFKLGNPPLSPCYDQFDQIHKYLVHPYPAPVNHNPFIPRMFTTPYRLVPKYCDGVNGILYDRANAPP